MYKTWYARLLGLVDFFRGPWQARFLVDEEGEFIRIDVPARQGNDGGPMAGYAREIGCSRRGCVRLLRLSY